MSSEQLLLTIGVALLVFDSKKIPKLIIHLATWLAICRKGYQEIVVKFEQIVRQAERQRQLEQNERKAQMVDKEY